MTFPISSSLKRTFPVELAPPPKKIKLTIETPQSKVFRTRDLIIYIASFLSPHKFVQLESSIEISWKRLLLSKRQLAFETNKYAFAVLDNPNFFSKKDQRLNKFYKTFIKENCEHYCKRLHYRAAFILLQEWHGTIRDLQNLACVSKENLFLTIQLSKIRKIQIEVFTRDIPSHLLHKEKDSFNKRLTDLFFEPAAKTRRKSSVVDFHIPNISLFKYLLKYASPDQKKLFLNQAFRSVFQLLKRIADEEDTSAGTEAIEKELYQFYSDLLIEFQKLEYPLEISRALFLENTIHGLIETCDRLLDFLKKHLTENQRVEFLKKLFSKELMLPEQPYTFLYEMLLKDNLQTIFDFSKLHSKTFSELVALDKIPFTTISNNYQPNMINSKDRDKYIAELVSFGAKISFQKYQIFPPYKFGITGKIIYTAMGDKTPLQYLDQYMLTYQYSLPLTNAAIKKHKPKIA